MALSLSRLAYADCYDIMDRALDDAQGVRVQFPTYEEAMYWRLRMHQARKLDRILNKEIRGKDDPMWGLSIYDTLIASVPKGQVWVYINNLKIEPRRVESLSALESQQALPAPEEQKALPPPGWRR